MSTPVIGLTTYNQENKYGFPIAALMHKYIAAIIEAGGAALLIPSGLTGQAYAALLDRMDGILFTGGGDVGPACYNAESHPRVEGVDPERDTVELALIKAVVETGKPFLGICRGLQVINVALGGTLYTHIPGQHPNAVKHNYDSGTEREVLAHEVVIEKGTRLAGVFGETRFPVNSLHHQGVKQMAQVFKAAGYAPDGLLEAAELPEHPFGVAVQWHPEWLTGLSPARRLFRAFVEAAGGSDS
jgi:putative glutamine amidotransferase